MNYRVTVDESNATLEKKILNAIKQKVPYMIIVGEREASSNTLTIRDREGNQTKNVTIEEFMNKIKNENNDIFK